MLDEKIQSMLEEDRQKFDQDALGNILSSLNRLQRPMLQNNETSFRRLSLRKLVDSRLGLFPISCHTTISFPVIVVLLCVLMSNQFGIPNE